MVFRWEIWEFSPIRIQGNSLARARALDGRTGWRSTWNFGSEHSSARSSALQFKHQYACLITCDNLYLVSPTQIMQKREMMMMYLEPADGRVAQSM